MALIIKYGDLLLICYLIDEYYSFLTMYITTLNINKIYALNKNGQQTMFSVLYTYRWKIV